MIYYCITEGDLAIYLLSLNDYPGRIPKVGVFFTPLSIEFFSLSLLESRKLNEDFF